MEIIVRSRAAEISLDITPRRWNKLLDTLGKSVIEPQQAPPETI